MTNKKYVVLENIVPDSDYNGCRFWTGTTEGQDPTKSAEGETWYKVVLYTDDEKEAIEACKTERNFEKQWDEMMNMTRMLAGIKE